MQSNLPEIYKKHDTVKLRSMMSFHANMAIVYQRCLNDSELNQEGRRALITAARIHLSMGDLSFKFIDEIAA